MQYCLKHFEQSLVVKNTSILVLYEKLVRSGEGLIGIDKINYL
jgi:hypothetical protein